MEIAFTHKCPNCGGPLLFNPKDQKFHCEYCLNTYAEEEVARYEQQQHEAHLENPSTTTAEENLTFTAEEKSSVMQQTETTEDETTTDADTMEIFSCPSRGAQIVTDATTAVTYCYYCHDPVVLAGRLNGEFLPENVLPFTIEKDEVIEKFLAWTKEKWFAPRDLFSKNQIDKLAGVYFPYWVVDAEVDGQLQATGTSICIWRVGDIEYTETKRFNMGRSGKLSSKKLVKNTLSKNVQQKMVEGVQPFSIDQAVPFKSQYLAGFQAEKRDIEYEVIKKHVQQELQDYSELLLRDSASGYTTLTNIRTDISLDQENNHYMLLPIRLVTYRNQEQSKKAYHYAMNGQTGRVSGILLISYTRLGLITLGIFAELLALFLLGGYSLRKSDLYLSFS